MGRSAASVAGRYLGAGPRQNEQERNGKAGITIAVQGTRVGGFFRSRSLLSFARTCRLVRLGSSTYSRSLSLSEDLPTCIILCMPPLLRGIRAPPSNFWGLTGNRALGGLGDRGPSGAKAVELAEAFGDINWETGTFGRYSGAALYPDATSGEGGSALRCASCSLAAQPALFIGGFRYGGRGGQSHRTEAFVAGLFYLLFWPFSWNKYDLAPSKFSHACGESYRPAHGKSGGRRHLSTNWMSTGRR